MEVTNALNKLGLNKEEAEIYQLLLSLGSATIGQISAFTELSRTKIYATLERLSAKRWVKLFSENPKRFIPLSPSKIILKKREELKEAYDSAEDELNKIYKTAAQKTEFISYRGSEALKKINEMILNAKLRIFIISSFLQTEILKKTVPYLEDAKKRGVSVKVLISKSLKEKNLLSRIKMSFESKSLIISKAGMIIADEEMMFGSAENSKSKNAEGEIVGIWTENHEFVEFNEMIFKRLEGDYE